MKFDKFQDSSLNALVVYINSQCILASSKPQKKFFAFCLWCYLIWPWSLFNILISLLVDAILWYIDQNQSGKKVDLSWKKKDMLIAKKLKFFGSREVHFWIRIWSGRGDGLRVSTEVWDDGNTANGTDAKLQGKLEKRQIYSKSIICFV